MYKKSRSGYTVNRNSGRQQEIPGTDSKILHIELLSGKPKFSKTQNSLRPRQTLAFRYVPSKDFYT